MFGKNLKYELRASARVLIPLFICVLAVGIFISVGFAVFGNIYFDVDETAEMSETLSAVGSAVMGLLFVAFSVLIMVTAVAALVLMVRRFYTSFFTDEAYLTFTLPVSVDCHLATKTVATVIWAIASGVVMFITFVIICFGIGIAASSVSTEEVSSVIESTGSSIWGEFSGTIIFMVINYIVSAFASLFLIYFAISFGCMVAKKHRFIVCILCYFVISGIVSTVSTVVTAVAMVPLIYAIEDADVAMMITYLISTVLSAAELVGCYFGTRYILTKKINLE